MALSIWGHVFVKVALIVTLFHVVLSKGRVIELNEDNWSQMLEGEWMVEFFAPWCPACKGLESTWKEFAEWSEELEISIASVDVTANPGLSGRFMVTTLPTIYHVNDGKFRQYRGSRSKEEFISFIEDKKWQSVEEIPGWKTPSSWLMSLVSYFFKLSMILRSIHNKLIEEYGLPYWGSYLMFAVATILIGAILGLILVCIIDFVFPPKSLPTLERKTDSPSNEEKNKNQVNKNKAEDEDMLDDENIKTNNSNEEVRKRRMARKDE